MLMSSFSPTSVSAAVEANGRCFRSDRKPSRRARHVSNRPASASSAAFTTSLAITLEAVSPTAAGGGNVAMYATCFSSVARSEGATSSRSQCARPS